MSRRQTRSRETREEKNAKIFDNMLLDEESQKPFGKGESRRRVGRIKPVGRNQEDYAAAIDQDDLIFGVGPAGTGKTYLSVGLAADRLAKRQIGKLILTRPAVEAEGERLGFLPGDMKAKIDPYLIPIYDVLYDRFGKANTIKMIDDGLIEICPLAFMRGRTLDNALIILDEMQNATYGQLKMAITRLGKGSKAIVTGDPDQIDPGVKSGLLDMIEKLEGEIGISVIRFEVDEVQRSEIVKRVLRRI